MRPVESFLHMMPHTVTIESLGSRNAYGHVTYGSSVAYRARVVGKQRMVTDTQGKEIISTHTIYLASNDMIDTTARITLPAGFVPSSPPIVSIGRYPDGTGIFATVVYVG